MLNKYTASPDGKCEWCMEPSRFIECHTCLSGVAVDAKVKESVLRKAKCGHMSVDYFYCIECKPACPSDLLGDLYNFCRSVQSFDLRKLGATHATGAIFSGYKKGQKHEPLLTGFDPDFFYPTSDAVPQSGLPREEAPTYPEEEV